MNTFHAPSIGLVELPELSEVLRQLGFRIISGATFPEAASAVKTTIDAAQSVADASGEAVDAFPILIADVHRPGIKAWAQKLSRTSPVLILRLDGANYIAADEARSLQLPATIREILTTAGLAVPADSQVDLTVGSQGEIVQAPAAFVAEAPAVAAAPTAPVWPNPAPAAAAWPVPAPAVAYRSDWDEDEAPTASAANQPVAVAAAPIPYAAPVIAAAPPIPAAPARAPWDSRPTEPVIEAAPAAYTYEPVPQSLFPDSATPAPVPARQHVNANTSVDVPAPVESTPVEPDVEWATIPTPPTPRPHGRRAAIAAETATSFVQEFAPAEIPTAPVWADAPAPATPAAPVTADFSASPVPPMADAPAWANTPAPAVSDAPTAGPSWSDIPAPTSPAASQFPAPTADAPAWANIPAPAAPVDAPAWTSMPAPAAPTPPTDAPAWANIPAPATPVAPAAPAAESWANIPAPAPTSVPADAAPSWANLPAPAAPVDVDTPTWSDTPAPAAPVFGAPPEWSDVSAPSFAQPAPPAPDAPSFPAYVDIAPPAPSIPTYVEIAPPAPDVPSWESMPQPVAPSFLQPTPPAQSAPPAWESMPAPVAPVAPIETAVEAWQASPTPTVQAPEPTPTPSFFSQMTVAPTPEPSTFLNPTGGKALAPCIFSWAYKGGVNKTSLTLQLAHRAAEKGLRVWVVDMNRGQGGVRTMLRISDNAPIRSAYDAALFNDPSKALVRPDEAQKYRNPQLDPLKFGIALAPPRAEADPGQASYLVYRQIIDYARANGDLVVVDTQTVEATDTSGLIDNVMLPLMSADAFGVAITEFGKESVDNLKAAFTSFSARGLPRDRQMLVVTRVKDFTEVDAQGVERKFQAYANFAGTTAPSDHVKREFDRGRIVSDDPAVTPLLDSVLLRATGDSRFDGRTEAGDSSEKPRRRGMFGGGRK